MRKHKTNIHIILLVSIILTFILLPEVATGQDGQPRKQTKRIKKKKEVMNDYDIMLFAGAGSDFSIFKGGLASRDPALVLYIGAELPIAWSGRLALEALFYHWSAETKPGYGVSGDENNRFLYGIKFYWLDFKKIKMATTLGSWGLPFINGAYAIEVSYIFNKSFDIGLAARYVAPDWMGGYDYDMFVIQFKYKL